MPELVATSYEDFVSKALSLASDEGRLSTLRSDIAARRHVLFGDLAPIRALEQVLAEDIRKARNSTAK
jgi:predicted O-linked N-acetylglucosamine transferase (SPINDLY family)